MSLTLSDLKYAVRLLVKRPGFALSTVLMLAGGLGISLYTSPCSTRCSMATCRCPTAARS